jgi:DNA primase large subunit
LAKYPFTPEAAKHVKELDLKTTELDNPEYSRIVERAQERIEEAITNAIVTDQTRNMEIELFSFPIAVMMVAASKDSFLKRRYALAEAKRAYNILKQEDEQKLTEVAETFNWKIKPAKHNANTLQTNPSDFTMHFTDYLKNTGNFHESKWKLVNRTMLDGETYITKDEAARLLSEEVRGHVEKKLQTEIDIKLPPAIEKEIERLKQMLDSRKGKIRQEEMPTEIVIDAFPPCMRQLYDMAPGGRHISHIGRFALTSFLINSGMPPETVIEHFRPTSDFSEKMTRYQVEHIAGGKGSRTKYLPPRCETLRTHSICPGRDETCGRVKHPLTYYKRKLRDIKAQTPEGAQ